MIDAIKELTLEEKEVLFKSTALVSIYAAFFDDHLDEKEYKEAKNLAHLRTITSSNELKSFYCHIEPLFENYYKDLLAKLPSEKEKKINFLMREIQKLNEVLDKLKKPFSTQLKTSLISYAKSISNCKVNFLEAFLFPLDIEGINLSSLKSLNPNS